jgi:hypothetical protein
MRLLLTISNRASRQKLTFVAVSNQYLWLPVPGRLAGFRALQFSSFKRIEWSSLSLSPQAAAISPDRALCAMVEAELRGRATHPSKHPPANEAPVPGTVLSAT